MPRVYAPSPYCRGPGRAESRSMKATIYGLVDPNTNQVRYVGRTTQTAARRLTAHLSEAKAGHPRPVYDWIRELHPLKPIMVILQEGVRTQVVARSKNDPAYSTDEEAETKWKKRFRRSPLLCHVPTETEGYRRLVNPPTIRAMRRGLARR
jgi:hypothetical protein